MGVRVSRRGAPSRPHDGTIFRPWALVRRFWIVLGAFLLLARSFIDFGSISERFWEAETEEKSIFLVFWEVCVSRPYFRTMFASVLITSKAKKHMDFCSFF